jgi:2-aminoadipate transaminase
MAETFSYKNLFASRIPTQPRRPSIHSRYDFAVAYPDPDSLPLEGLWQALREAIRRDGRDLALYPPLQGDERLRGLIARKLAKERGMRVAKEQIALANGSMQAITHLIEVFVDPGDTLVTEQFFYLGTLRSMRRFGANVVGVPTDEEGLIPEELEKTLRRLTREGKRPKFIYTIPSYQNPLGSVLPLERRRRLLEVAGEYGVPIVEDDCYVDLRFEGEMPPAIHSLDETGQVIYLGSFSKIVAPGVRLGWLVAPEEVMGRFLAVKLDGGPNQLAALAVEEYLRKEMESHIQEINAILRVKRDAMLSALGENFPPSCRWSRPKGGLYIWLELPEGADAARMQEAALKEGVAYYPGNLFSPQNEGRNCLRLCFGYLSPGEIQEGIRILARVFEREGAFSP